jgi:hypothetical protein
MVDARVNLNDENSSNRDCAAEMQGGGQHLKGQKPEWRPRLELNGPKRHESKGSSGDLTGDRREWGNRVGRKETDFFFGKL